MSTNEFRTSGELPNELANAISNAIAAALKKGLGTDIATCIAVGVAADYARGQYGNLYLPQLASVVIARAHEPNPTDISLN